MQPYPPYAGPPHGHAPYHQQPPPGPVPNWAPYAHQPHQAFPHPPPHHGHPVAPNTMGEDQSCFNCGQPDHWAQHCPEPRRAVPAGSLNQAQRNNPRKRVKANHPAHQYAVAQSPNPQPYGAYHQPAAPHGYGPGPAPYGPAPPAPATAYPPYQQWPQPMHGHYPPPQQAYNHPGQHQAVYGPHPGQYPDAQQGGYFAGNMPPRGHHSKRGHRSRRYPGHDGHAPAQNNGHERRPFSVDPAQPAEVSGSPDASGFPRPWSRSERSISVSEQNAENGEDADEVTAWDAWPWPDVLTTPAEQARHPLPATWHDNDGYELAAPGPFSEYVCEENREEFYRAIRERPEWSSFREDPAFLRLRQNCPMIPISEIIGRSQHNLYRGDEYEDEDEAGIIEQDQGHLDEDEETVNRYSPNERDELHNVRAGPVEQSTLRSGTGHESEYSSSAPRRDEAPGQQSAGLSVTDGQRAPQGSPSNHGHVSRVTAMRGARDPTKRSHSPNGNGEAVPSLDADGRLRHVSSHEHGSPGTPSGHSSPAIQAPGFSRNDPRSRGMDRGYRGRASKRQNGRPARLPPPPPPGQGPHGLAAEQRGGTQKRRRSNSPTRMGKYLGRGSDGDEGPREPQRQADDHTPKRKANQPKVAEAFSRRW